MSGSLGLLGDIGETVTQIFAPNLRYMLSPLPQSVTYLINLV